MHEASPPSTQCVLSASPGSPGMTLTIPSKENMLTPPPLNPLHSSEFYPTIGPGVRSDNCSYCRFPISHGGDHADADIGALGATSVSASVVHSRCGHAYHRDCLMKWVHTRPERSLNPCYVCGRRDPRRRSSSLTVSVISRRPSVVEQRYARDSMSSRGSRASSLVGSDMFRDFDGDFSQDVSDAGGLRDGTDELFALDPAVPERSGSLNAFAFSDFDGDYTGINNGECSSRREMSKPRTRALTPAVPKSKRGEASISDTCLDSEGRTEAYVAELRQRERCNTFDSIELESLIDEPISPILPQSGVLAGVRAPDRVYQKQQHSTVFPQYRNIKINGDGKDLIPKPSGTARPQYLRSHTSAYVDRARAHEMSLPPGYSDAVNVDVERGKRRRLSRRCEKRRHCWASSKSNKLSMTLLATVMTVVVAIVIVVVIVSARKHHRG